MGHNVWLVLMLLQGLLLLLLLEGLLVQGLLVVQGRLLLHTSGNVEITDHSITTVNHILGMRVVNDIYGRLS